MNHKHSRQAEDTLTDGPYAILDFCEEVYTYNNPSFLRHAEVALCNIPYKDIRQPLDQREDFSSWQKPNGIPYFMASEIVIRMWMMVDRFVIECLLILKGILRLLYVMLGWNMNLSSSGLFE